jgi:membrane-associated phospholipid phosphatase
LQYGCDMSRLLVRDVAALSNRCVQVATGGSLRRDIARLTSTVAAPAPVAIALVLGVACYSSRGLVEGLALGGLLATCATLPPTLYIEHVRASGGSRRLARGADRLAPLAIACAVVFVDVLLVRALEGAREVQTVLLTMLLVLGLALGATPITRISVHSAATTGSIVVLQLLFGTVGVALLPIVVIVGWSRLELGEHTPAQVVCGALIGGVGAIVAYRLLG